MTDGAVAPLERAQKLAGWASIVAVLAAVILVVTALTSDVAWPALEQLRSTHFTPDWPGVWTLVKTILTHLVLAAPGLLMGWALWELSHVLDEYGKGRFFTLRASVGVRSAAEDALWALAFKVVLSPTIYGFITHDSRGVEWRYESFDIGFAGFAAFLAVIGRVLEAAARIKAENDEIV
jgi:hypothetical protein